MKLKKSQKILIYNSRATRQNIHYIHVQWENISCNPHVTGKISVTAHVQLEKNIYYIHVKWENLSCNPHITGKILSYDSHAIGKILVTNPHEIEKIKKISVTTHMQLKKSQLRPTCNRKNLSCDKCIISHASTNLDVQPRIFLSCKSRRTTKDFFQLQCSIIFNSRVHTQEKKNLC